MKLARKSVWIKAVLLSLVLILSLVVVAGAQGRKTITFAHYWPAFLGKGLRAVADEYESKNPNIKIEFRFVPWADFATKFMIEAAAGTAADVNLVEHSWQGTLFAVGLAAKLDSYANREPDKWELDRFFPGILDSLGRYRGDLVGIPHIVEREAFSINLDILKVTEHRISYDFGLFK